MTYFKDTNNKPFYEPSEAVIVKHNLTPISEEEFNSIVTALNTPTNEQIRQQQIQEAKQYLASTDWYYARKMETGEEVPADVVTKRLEARTLINELEVTQ